MFMSILQRCPNGSMVWESSCYLFVPQTLSQSDASAACNVLGSHLAVITSAAENVAITNYLQSTGYTTWGIYIGNDDVDVEGTYVWNTGEDFVFQGWDTNEPGGFTSENCCVTTGSGKWHDVSCNRLHAFVCEMPCFI